MNVFDRFGKLFLSHIARRIVPLTYYARQNLIDRGLALIDRVGLFHAPGGIYALEFVDKIPAVGRGEKLDFIFRAAGKIEMNDDELLGARVNPVSVVCRNIYDVAGPGVNAFFTGGKIRTS